VVGNFYCCRCSLRIPSRETKQIQRVVPRIHQWQRSFRNARKNSLQPINKKLADLIEVGLLYLLGENITTFDYYLHKGAVKIQYLTATCEGLAFGGARRSIYDYLQKQRYYAHNKMDGFDLRWLTSSAGSGTVSRLMGQAQAEGSVRFTQVGNTVGFAHPISEVKVCN